MKVKLSGLSISAIASTIPKNSVDFSDLIEKFGETEIKRITVSTGISKLRVAEKGVCTSDLCVAAARFLFEKLNVAPQSFDGIVLFSQIFDHIIPATSAILQNKLGLPKTAVAFDIRYGCSAYIYAIYQASLLIASGSCNKILVLAGDVISPTINRYDKALKMVMGDAGSATIVEKGNDTLSFNIMTDGAGYDRLIIPAGGSRYPRDESSGKELEKENGNIRSEENLYMDGMEIMNFCLREVPKIVDEVLELADWKKEDIGIFAMHQANKFIVDYIRKKMKVLPETLPVVIGEIGNTGPGTIPHLFSAEHKRLISEKRLSKSVMCGFGVGFSWGAITADLSKTKFFDPVEV